MQPKLKTLWECLGENGNKFPLTVKWYYEVFDPIEITFERLDNSDTRFMVDQKSLTDKYFSFTRDIFHSGYAGEYKYELAVKKLTLKEKLDNIEKDLKESPSFDKLNNVLTLLSEVKENVQELQTEFENEPEWIKKVFK